MFVNLRSNKKSKLTMKKTHYLLKLYGAVLTLLVVIAIGSYSCKKDNAKQSQETESLISDYAKITKNLNKNDFSQLQPNWNSLYTSEYDNDVFYEVDLINPNHFFLTDQKTDPEKASEYEKFNNIKLLIRKDKETGKTTFYYMSLISGKMNPDFRNMHYKKLPDFTGSVHYYSLNGEFINGWTYNDGKVANKLKALSAKLMTQMSLSPQKLSPTVGCPIEEIERYQTICAMGDGHTDMECVRRLIGNDHVFTDCTGDSSDDGDGGGDGGVGDSGGGGGDSPPPPYYDCTGLLDGTAYNSDCGCIGGNTGIENCEQKTIIDSLRGYPCAQDLLRKFPTLRTAIANLVKSTFAVNDNINMTFQVNLTLAGTTTDGRTIAPTGYVPGITDEETVELNPDVLKYATKEYILVTLYHEALHAYFNKMKHQLSPAEFTSRFGTLTVNGGRTLFPEVDGHFEMAANKYLNGLRDVIIAFNPNYDTNRAYALALAGVVQLSPANKAINDQERDTRKIGYTGTKCPQ
jgi:hypothetical protein